MKIVKASDIQVGDEVSSLDKRYAQGDPYERRGRVISVRHVNIDGTPMIRFRSTTNTWSCSPDYPFAVGREPWTDPDLPSGRMTF